MGVPVVSPIPDLDLQLKKHGIHQLIVTGLIAHTCVEAMFVMPLRLATKVTMVKTRPRITRMRMHAALHVNIPNYASAVVTTNVIVDSISSL